MKKKESPRKEREILDYDARITFLKKKNPSYGKLVKAEVMIIGMGVEVAKYNGNMDTWRRPR